MTQNRNKFREGQGHKNDRCNRFAVALSVHLRHCKAGPYENGLRGTILTLSHERLFEHAQPGIGIVPNTQRALTTSLGCKSPYTRASHAFQQVQKGQENNEHGIHGKHFCHLNLPYPAFTRVSSAIPISFLRVQECPKGAVPLSTEESRVSALYFLSCVCERSERY